MTLVEVKIIEGRDSETRRPLEIAVFTLAVVMIMAGCGSSQGRPFFEAADGAAAWLQQAGLPAEGGMAWPADPENPTTVNDTLYAGTPGVILFFLEAFHQTGKRSYLNTARKGAEHLLSVLDAEKQTGLYTGLSGIAYCLEETYKASSEKKYRDGVDKIFQRLQDQAYAPLEDGAIGLTWGPVTDIISGDAGTGLFLLYLYRERKDEAVLDLASRVGHYLLGLGIRDGGGLKWAMSADYPRLMPNFSHGTAGIAYFLLELYRLSREEEFLAGALAGARYLTEIADSGENHCLIFHHEPDGEDLFYLGWCHGPVGTARLFLRLAEVTADDSWLEWARKGGQSILDSGIPEKESPGFWNNVGICCGSAGVADYFLNLHKITADKKHLAFARRLLNQVLDAATREGGRLKWIQAEHRSRPELLQAQTGLMQGAAGIGLVLLRMDAFDRGRNWKVILPDSHF